MRLVSLSRRGGGDQWHTVAVCSWYASGWLPLVQGDPSDTAIWPLPPLPLVPHTTHTAAITAILPPFQHIPRPGTVQHNTSLSSQDYNPTSQSYLILFSVYTLSLSTTPRDSDHNRMGGYQGVFSGPGILLTFSVVILSLVSSTAGQFHF